MRVKYFACLSLLFLISCATSVRSGHCLSTKVDLSDRQMWRLRKFVAWHEQDKKYGRSWRINNDVKNYCFSREVVDSSGYGLFAVSRFGLHHGGTPLFIKSKSLFTVLKFSRNLPKAQDSIRNKRILERALAIHSTELSDSLKNMIRNQFWFNKTSN